MMSMMGVPSWDGDCRWASTNVMIAVCCFTSPLLSRIIYEGTLETKKERYKHVALGRNIYIYTYIYVATGVPIEYKLNIYTSDSLTLVSISFFNWRFKLTICYLPLETFPMRENIYIIFKILFWILSISCKNVNYCYFWLLTQGLLCKILMSYKLYTFVLHFVVSFLLLKY